MKKIGFLSILLSLMLLIPSCIIEDEEEFIGSGNIISETRIVDPFENIIIKGVVTTTISYGESQSLIVMADDNIIDLVNSTVSQNTLTVEFEEGKYSKITVMVNVIIPILKSLTNNGVTTTSVNDFFNLNDLVISNTGVGELELKGSANKLILQNEGTGLFKGFGFTIDTCEINQTGVGDIQLKVNDLLKGSLTGVGNIYYKGNPAIDVTITGVGNVIDSN